MRSPVLHQHTSLTYIDSAGSGGVRKRRWGWSGRGKRGGIRVIYHLRSRQGEVWMLTLYAKNEADRIPAHILKKIKEEIDGGA